MKNVISLRPYYQIMEEDILNYSPTVMFRGTPCIRFEIRYDI